MIPLSTVLDELAHELSWTEDGVEIRSLFVHETAGRGRAAVRRLGAFIYDRYYARILPDDEPGAEAARRDHITELERLEAAVGPRRYWDPGWTLRDDDAGMRVLDNGRLRVHAAPSDVAPAEASAGDEVRLRLPCARPHVSPGFFYFFGPAGPVGGGAVLRHYLNLEPAAGPALVRCLLEALEDVPLEGKLACAPRGQRRWDAGVLYARAVDEARVGGVLSELSVAHPDWWRWGVPLFTRPLARGVSVAESPPAVDGARPSFGRHRCDILARALFECLRDAVPPSGWMQRVSAGMRERGVDPDRPERAVSGRGPPRPATSSSA